MATKSGPILVFVPGAWHTAACFSKIINLLKSLPSPSRCVAVDLPSVGAPEGSLARKSRQPDIDAVRTAIETEVRERRPVLLVEHSYGSVPGQEAVREFGGTGVVKQLIISGFLLDVGESILSFNKGKIPPMWDIQVCSSLLSIPAFIAFFSRCRNRRTCRSHGESSERS